MVLQLLLGRALVLVQQDCLVVTAGEAALVSVNPASRILLLNKVSFGLIQAVFVEWVTIVLIEPLMPPSQSQSP